MTVVNAVEVICKKMSKSQISSIMTVQNSTAKDTEDEVIALEGNNNKPLSILQQTDKV